MAIFAQKVIERREYEVLYTVEAESKEEALKKVAIGETLSEVIGKSYGVVTREPLDAMIKLYD